MAESKTVKSALKEARELIDKKDHRAALKACKRALNVEKDNYLALVFAGLCCSEIDNLEQAKESYRRAISKDPEQPVAWQGMVSFCEKHVPKHADLKSDLVYAYRGLAKALAAKQDIEKYFDVTSKLWQLVLEMQDVDGALEVLEEQADTCREKDQFKSREARSSVVKILSQRMESLTDQQANLLAKTLKDVTTEDQSIQNQENLKLSIKLSYQLRDLQTLLASALQMNKVFPSNAYPLEWICKVFLEYVTGTLDFKSADLEHGIVGKYVDRLLELNPNSVLGKLSRGATLWQEGKAAEARDVLKAALASNPSPNFFGSFVLCRCLVELRDYPQAESAIEAAKLLLDKVKEESSRQKMERELNILLVRSLYFQSSAVKIARAKEVIQSVDGVSGEFSLIFLKIKASTDASAGEVEKELVAMGDAVEKHEADLVRAMLANSKGNRDKAKEHLNSCLATCPEHFESLLLLGKIHYDDDDLRKSLPAFLKAARLNSSSAAPFLYLGHHYQRQGDLDKARKCYQKSFQLDSTSEEAGSALSDVYREQGDTSSNLQFLSSYCLGAQPSPSNCWAFLRLGTLYLERDDPTKAILAFQSVIRTVSEDHHVWECLADAYKARGSYNAALKAYDKVLKLHSDSPYAQLQIGGIKQLLGKYLEAVRAFRSVLVLNGEDVPALKGLGEALIAQAGEYLEAHVNGNAMDNCAESLCVLTKAARLRPDLSCLWKLMGEACAMLRQLPEELLAGFAVPPVLVGKAETSGDERVVIGGKREILQLGTKCYLRALFLLKDDEAADISGSCWHDLSLCYHARANELSSVEKEEAGKLRDKSMSAAKRAITLSPSDKDHWNLLGLVAAKAGNFALAQHAFIRSVKLESSAIAWTNLGTLYLMLGEADLANKSFKEAQNQDPSFLRGWVGQALLAEQAGFQEEAMDLFRHTTFLGNELESSVGYANWVCKTLASLHSEDQGRPHNRYCVERLHGVPAAVDCLTRFTQRARHDPCALNMFGIVLERQRLWRSAEAAYKLALGELQDPVLVDKVRLNLGRVCLKLSLFEEAIAHFSSVSSPTFHSLTGLAVASYRAGMFQQSYSAYQKCLALCSPAEKSHVLAAMAAIAFRVQGPDAAKTLLFQSCQLSPASVRGLFALCVLGIKQRNPDLTRAALKEMSAYADDPRYMSDVCALRALVRAENVGEGEAAGGETSARRAICRQLHRYPQVSGLWAVLATHVVSRHEKSPPALLSAASASAAKSAGLARSLSEAIPMSHGDATPTNLITLSLLLARNADGVRRLRSSAAKSVHLYPEQAQSWGLLLAAVLPAAGRAQDVNEAKTVRLVLEKTMGSLGDDGGMRTWVEKVAERIR